MKPDRAIWITVRRYCEVYSVNRKTVYKWIAAELLQARRHGRLLRVANEWPDSAKSRSSP